MKILKTFRVSAVSCKSTKQSYFFKFWNVPEKFGTTDFIGFICP